MLSSQRIDHVGIAVWSLTEAYRLYHDALGGEFVNGGDEDKHDIRTLQLRLGSGPKIELLQPLAEDTPLHRFLEQRGQGVHHITIFVDDVRRTAAELERQGYELVDGDFTQPTWRETYIRPRSGFGALLQLVQSTLRWDLPPDGITAEDVLAGRVLWSDNVPTLRP